MTKAKPTTRPATKAGPASRPTAGAKNPQGKSGAAAKATTVPASADTTSPQSPEASLATQTPRQTKAALLRMRLAEPGGVSLAEAGPYPARGSQRIAQGWDGPFPAA